MREKSERIKKRYDDKIDKNKDVTVNSLPKLKKKKMRIKRAIDEHIIKIETADDNTSHQFELLSMNDLITAEVLLDIYLHIVVTFKKSIQDFRVKNLELIENMSQEMYRKKMKQILDYIRCIEKDKKATFKKNLVCYFFLNLIIYLNH
jgi:hypothetical protein